MNFEKSIHTALWGSESWEVSAHPSDPSVIVGGGREGETLREVFPDFPLLFKVIDAKTRLSVQVHPNEETCKVTGGEPKTEMWCALSDGPIYAGLCEDATAADVEAAVKTGKFENLLVRHEAKFDAAFLVHGQPDRQAPDPRDIVPELSLGFVRFLEAMLVKDREGRIKSWPLVFEYCREVENGGDGFELDGGFVSSVRHPTEGMPSGRGTARDGAKGAVGTTKERTT